MFGPADTAVHPWKRWECRPDLCLVYHYWDGSRWWEDGVPYQGRQLPCMRGRGPEAPRDPLPASPVLAPPSDVVDRARKYVALLPGAIEGNGGSAATFHVAQVLVRGFALAPGEALALLTEYNARCSPPWAPHDLKHKVRQAMQRGTMKVGKMLEKPR